MSASKVLIVENDPLVAMTLKMMVLKVVDADVVLAPTVETAERLVSRDLDFAFLDVRVTNGETFDVAAALRKAGVHMAFVSTVAPAELPPEVRGLPIIHKPFRPSDIERALRRR
jgi:two-component SAPR family response regulator